MSPVIFFLLYVPSVSAISSWCLADRSVPQALIQIQLDLLCGDPEVDCSVIKPGSCCYVENDVWSVASVIFNNLYVTKRSCNFNGRAQITLSNPSSEASCCSYPSIPLPPTAVYMAPPPPSPTYTAPPQPKDKLGLVEVSSLVAVGAMVSIYIIKKLSVHFHLCGTKNIVNVDNIEINNIEIH